MIVANDNFIIHRIVHSGPANRRIIEGNVKTNVLSLCCWTGTRKYAHVNLMKGTGSGIYVGRLSEGRLKVRFNSVAESLDQPLLKLMSLFYSLCLCL